ncbi:hypothetical protein N7466_008158 [Penicillium verhagenii]|uniref:uncharacterized protein n=1 Tax=Penicillium verhagenii TaxID=1562060 RepID=UPI0025456595|nr:uncharacterized protein N7466_008158 [Penicillium verhagenii]KAJ5923971.1 hypothetical protein N7466_008158 [Penicillium verhagenii]
MDFFSGFLMSNSSGTFHALGHNWLGKADIAVQTVLLSGGFVLVGLRLWSRRLLGVSWQWNDWLILASMMVMLGRYVVELLLILMCGLGLHTAEVTQLGGDETIVRFDKLTYIGDLLWITVVALIQLSILHYYFRQFQQRVIVWLTYITMALCSALWIGSSFATAFFCTPAKKIWLPNLSGHCGDRKMLHLGSTVSEAILEAFILCLPLPIILHMQLSKAKKLALAPVFLLGIIILTATLIRIKIEFDLNSDDPTFGSARKSLLSCIVPLLGIIVACLPIISPSIQRIFRTKILSSPSEGATYGYRSSYYKPTVLSGRQMEEPEIPLVSVMQPPMAKKLSEWCHGQIKITSDWEIHSTRNSARLDKDSIRKA